ncbi:hypothetical protein ACQJBY_014889 [Aegilops geniculata]
MAELVSLSAASSDSPPSPLLRRRLPAPGRFCVRSWWSLMWLARRVAQSCRGRRLAPRRRGWPSSLAGCLGVGAGRGRRARVLRLVSLWLGALCPAGGRTSFPPPGRRGGVFRRCSSGAATTVGMRGTSPPCARTRRSACAAGRLVTSRGIAPCRVIARARAVSLLRIFLGLRRRSARTFCPLRQWGLRWFRPALGRRCRPLRPPPPPRTRCGWGSPGVRWFVVVPSRSPAWLGRVSLCRLRHRRRWGVACPRAPRRLWWMIVDCVFLESRPDLCALEEELARAVVVSVVGSRQQADLATVAATIVQEFELQPADMSIREFYPEEFLVLCRSVEIRNRLIRRGRAGTQHFDLLLRPWSRRARATEISMPFLAPLALRGVPANAWTRRTADTLLHGLGIVVKVAASTEARNDMSGFRVWLRTDDPARIPSRRILVVEEPSRRSARALNVSNEADALWYPVSICQEGGPVRLGPQVGAPPPPPSDGDGRGGRGPEDARGGRGFDSAPGQERGSPSSGGSPAANGSADPALALGRQRQVQTGLLAGQQRQDGGGPGLDDSACAIMGPGDSVSDSSSIGAVRPLEADSGGERVGSWEPPSAESVVGPRRGPVGPVVSADSLLAGSGGTPGATAVSLQADSRQGALRPLEGQDPPASPATPRVPMEEDAISAQEENMILTRTEVDFGGSGSSRLVGSWARVSEGSGPGMHADGTCPCTHRAGDGWFAVSLSDQAVSPVPPPTQPSPQEHVARFCSELRQALSPLLSQPTTRALPHKTRKPRQKRPPVTSPRRSVRLAKGGRGSKATKQQAVLIRKLCLAHDGDQITDEALQACVDPMSRRFWLCSGGTHRRFRWSGRTSRWLGVRRVVAGLGGFGGSSSWLCNPRNCWCGMCVGLIPRHVGAWFTR